MTPLLFIANILSLVAQLIDVYIIVPSNVDYANLLSVNISIVAQRAFYTLMTGCSSSPLQNFDEINLGLERYLLLLMDH